VEGPNALGHAFACGFSVGPLGPEGDAVSAVFVSVFHIGSTDPQALRLSHRTPPGHSTPRRHASPQTRTGDQETRVRIPSASNPYWNRARLAQPAHSTFTRTTRRTVSLLAKGSRFTVTVLIGPPRRIGWKPPGRWVSGSTGSTTWSALRRSRSLLGCGGQCR